MSASYTNRHNIKPVLRNFTRGAHRAMLDEVLYRVNTVAQFERGSGTGTVQLAKTTAAQIRSASKQQGEEAIYTNVTG